MPTKAIVPPFFKKALQKLFRKYPAVLDEFEILKLAIEKDERPGDKIPNVGYDVYKERLKNPSAKKGKSGGFRVIYYVYIRDTVFFLSIYSKSEQENISPEAIQNLIDDLDLSQSDEDE